MKIGDYVRTINGEIYKLIDDFALIYFQKEQEHGIPEHQIIKSSPNIIDLIEENDFVNHSRVVCIGISTDLTGTHKYLVLENRGNCANGNIKSIVTREMFESMKYKVGE